MIREVRKNKLFFVIVVSILFFSFSFDFFGAVTADSFVSNYKDSEALVVNQVRCKGSLFGGQLLQLDSKYIATETANSCDDSVFVPYSSQFGLQGKVYTIGYQILSKVSNISLGAYIALAQLATALLSAAMFGLFLIWIKERFGYIVANTATILIAVSPMLVGFSRNLYWAVPLFIAPFIFTIYYFKIKNSRKELILFWLGLWILLYLRYLCGYEYITTITVMIFAAISYSLYLKKSKLRFYVKQIILAGTISVLAFVAAIATHVVALNIYTGSISKSISIITKRAEERTVNSDAYLEYPYMNLKFLVGDYYKISNTYVDYADRQASGSKAWSTLTAFSNYMLLPIVNLPINLASPFSLYIQSMLFFIIYLSVLYAGRRRWLVNKSERQIRALYVGLVVSLVGYFSWLILAYSHALVHAHINGILMYLPFALFGYIVVGLFIESIIISIKNKNR